MESRVTGRFNEAGSLTRPGPIGRTIRLFNGLGVIAIVVWIVINAPMFVDDKLPGLIAIGLIAVGVVAAVLNTFNILTISLRLPVGYWGLVVAVVPIIATAVFDWIFLGAIWAAPLGLSCLLSWS